MRCRASRASTSWSTASSPVFSVSRAEQRPGVVGRLQQAGDDEGLPDAQRRRLALDVQPVLEPPGVGAVTPGPGVVVEPGQPVRTREGFRARGQEPLGRVEEARLDLGHGRGVTRDGRAQVGQRHARGFPRAPHLGAEEVQRRRPGIQVSFGGHGWLPSCRLAGVCPAARRPCQQAPCIAGSDAGTSHRSTGLACSLPGPRIRRARFSGSRASLPQFVAPLRDHRLRTRGGVADR